MIAMIESARPCLEIAQQLQAVESAIRAAKKTLIHDHIDHCLGQAADGRIPEFAFHRGVQDRDEVPVNGHERGIAREHRRHRPDGGISACGFAHPLAAVRTGRPATRLARNKTLAIAALAGSGHVLFTIVLGAMIAWFGIAMDSWIGNVFPYIAEAS